MEAGESRITVSVSYKRRRMHSAQGKMVYGEHRMAGARKPRWGSAAWMDLLVTFVTPTPCKCDYPPVVQQLLSGAPAIGFESTRIQLK
jgi:hypothetical protein